MFLLLLLLLLLFVLSRTDPKIFRDGNSLRLTQPRTILVASWFGQGGLKGNRWTQQIKAWKIWSCGIVLLKGKPWDVCYGPKKQCLSKFGLVHFFFEKKWFRHGCRYEIWGILSLIDEVFFWQIGNPLKCSEGVWSFWFIETWNRRKLTSQISCISYLIDTISWFFRLPSSLVGSYKGFTRKIQLWLELELHHFKRPASWSSRISL